IVRSERNKMALKNPATKRKVVASPVEPTETTLEEQISVAGDPTTYSVQPGRPHPLGATPDAEGVNFSVLAEKATEDQLLIFDAHDDIHMNLTIDLDPNFNKSFHFWHVYVKGLKPGAHYAYRIDGPFDPHNGFRYNRNKVLIDPYAKGNTNTLWD